MSRCSVAPVTTIQFLISELPEFILSLGNWDNLVRSFCFMPSRAIWSSSSSTTKWLNPPEARIPTRCLFGQASMALRGESTRVVHVFIEPY